MQGFKRGGEFAVPGDDTDKVRVFRVLPGKTVHVRTPAQQRAVKITWRKTRLVKNGEMVLPTWLVIAAFVGLVVAMVARAVQS